MIEVLIKWETDEEVDRMVRISSVIREALRDAGDFAGHSFLDGTEKINSIGLRNNVE